MKKYLSLILVLIMISQVFAIAASANNTTLAQDYDALTEESILKVPLREGDFLIDNLKLPSTGVNGSSIEWICEPEGIIETSVDGSMGKLLRPENDTQVRLTAKLTDSESVAPLEKEFIFTVAGARTGVYEMPVHNSTNYYDDFENDEINTDYIDTTEGGDSITEENGTLNLNVAANTGVTIYLNEDKSAATGKTVTEFVINRRSSDIMVMEMLGNNTFCYVTWWDKNTNVTNLSFVDSNSGGSIAHHVKTSADFDAVEKLKVTLYYDADNGTISFYLNNKLAGEGLARPGTTFDRVYIRSNATSISATVDDFHHYNAEMVLSNNSISKKDSDALKQGGVNSFLKAPLGASGLLVDNLALPTKGQYGSEIEWSGSPEGIIDSDGTLTRPNEDTALTLTAEVKKGSYSNTAEFNINVAGKNTRADDMPLVSEMIYYDKFDNEEIGENIVLNEAGAQITEENGVLHFKKAAAGGESGADIYMKEDKSSVSGAIVAEFIMQRSSRDTFSAQLFGEDNEPLAYITWWSYDITLSFADEKGGERKNYTISASNFDAANKLKVTVYFEPDSGNLVLWLNNKYADMGYSLGAENFSKVYFYNGNSAFDVTIDDFKCYSPDFVLSDSLAINADSAQITQDSFYKVPKAHDTLVIDSLKLPESGKNGSTISWTASPSGIISSDGSLLERPQNDTQITLTASVQKGTATPVTKEFNVTVAGKETIVKDLPIVEEQLYYNGFLSADTQTELNAGTGTAEIENGAVCLEKEAVNGKTSASIFLKEDKSAAEGSYATEFILSRKAQKEVNVAFKNADSSLLDIKWGTKSDNEIVIKLADSPDGAISERKIKITDYKAEESVKVTLFADSAANQFALWINQEFITTGYFLQSGGISNVEIFNSNSTFDCTVDDFRYYDARISAANDEIVEADADDLTEAAILKAPKLSDGRIIDNLNLYSSGKRGSRIVWTSTNPDVIDSKGNVTRQMNDEPVTLTASISYLGSTPVTESYPFVVAGLSSQPENMPILTSQAYYENFDDGVVDDEHIVLNDGNGMARETGGELSIIKPVSSGITSAYVYPGENRGLFSGKFVVEFTMKRKENQDISAQLYDQTGIYMIVTWWKSSTGITLQYADEKGGERTSHTVPTADYGATDTLKVTAYFDTNNQTCNIWLNNKYYAETGYSCGAKGIEWVYFYNQSSTCDCSVDDFRVYYAQEEDERAVELDAEALKEYFKSGELEDGVLYKDVALPNIGKHGSSITWETHPESLMLPDGTINRPATDSEANTVTVRAFVTKGSASAEKEFVYKILPLGTGDMEIVKRDAQELIFENIISQPELVDGYISHDLKLPEEGKFGSEITWESTQPSVLSHAGKILSYPNSADEATEIIMRATVSYGGESIVKEIPIRILPLDVADDRIALPEVYESVFEERFSNDNNSVSHWFLRPQDSGIIERKNNRLELTRTVNSSLETYARIYSDASKDDLNGLVGFSFDIEKQGTGDAIIRLVSGDSKKATALSTMTWKNDNTFSISHAVRKGGGATTAQTSAYNGTVTVTGLIDTVRGHFTLWLNGTAVLMDVYPEQASDNIGLLYVELALAKNNLISIYMDNVHYYYARPLDFEQTYFDSLYITEESILTKDLIIEKTIDSDLILPTVGHYGSDITWLSSDESLINPITGEVTRPSGVSVNPYVTITAVITHGDYVTKKSFDFYVLRRFDSDEAFVDADLEFLTAENYNMYSFNDDNANEIRTSLNLPSELAYSSEIIWTTSNPKAITDSGRVIRGRWDEGSKDVVLTATVTYGNCTKTKEFPFTVLPDEELTDPEYMPDEEFFGVWNGTEWSQTGKFDYDSYPDMAKIEAAAKEGNYEKAKEELLSYMISRPESVINKSGGARNTNYVDQMMLTGVWHYQSDRFYMGHNKITNHEYEQLRFPIRTNLLIAGANSYRIAAKYNESSSVTIASKEHPEVSYRPKLEVVVNGQRVLFDAEADATIRGGEYSYTNYGREPEMKVKMFGEFQGDETYAATIRFNLGEALPAGKIESAALILTAKIDQQSATSKELLVNEEPSITWDEDVIAWGRLEHYFYNVNGIPGGMDWLRAYPANCDSEFHQTHRFPMWPQILSEYIYTGDEKYAYTMIYTMMDYIIDSQYTMSISDWNSYNGGYHWTDYEELYIPGTQNKNYSLKRRGGMPQLLGTSFRWSVWMASFERLLQSKYMTPDVCTTLLKNLWDCSNEGDKYLYDYVLHQVEPKANNQWVFEANNIAQAAVFMPEFSAGNGWVDNMNDVLLFVKNAGYGPDGAYGEAANGYSANVIGAYIDYVLMAEKAGLELPDGFADFIYDSVIYNELLSRDSAGIAMSYGDSGFARSFGRVLEAYEKINPDGTYLFLDTRGAKGVQPDWTSKQFESNSTTFMRSDWSNKALHLFTDCNTMGGGHGHADDNSMRISAFGEYLLIDPGMFSYEDTIYRRYGKSTRSHNTVEVDDTSQMILSTEANLNEDLPGEVHEWSTNSQFDVLSQTTAGYDHIGVDHRRTITFLKSGFWIVSDLMKTDDNSTPHDYKQLWHMLPSSNQVLNYEKGTISSNTQGANIIMASHDGTLTPSPVYDPSNPKQNDGWYTSRWGVYEYAPYAYYAKDNVTGSTGFDTVVLPYKQQGQGSALTEDIDLGVPVDVATAMNITTTVGDETHKTAYMLQYSPVLGNVRAFGEYKGDAMVNVVSKDNSGNIVEAIINGGSTLRSSDGSIILDTDGTDANIGLTFRGDTVVIVTNDTEISPDKISFVAANNVKNVMVNGKYYAFTVNGNTIDVSSTETNEVLENDWNEMGGVQGDSSIGGDSAGGSSGGSGSEGGSGGDDSGSEDKDDDKDDDKVPTDKSFKDIEGHWAYNSIMRMASMNVVEGSDGYFRPDASISRAELVTMIVRVLKLESNEKENPFADVSKGSWYYDYVAAAFENGIISKDSVFRPNDLITREEMSKMLSIAHAIHNNKEAVAGSEAAENFEDFSGISSWAVNYVNYAAENNLIKGMDNNLFAPKLNATRAQIVTVLDRIFK